LSDFRFSFLISGLLRIGGFLRFGFLGIHCAAGMGSFSWLTWPRVLAGALLFAVSWS
jgi:hypothetical protein